MGRAAAHGTSGAESAQQGSTSERRRVEQDGTSHRRARRPRRARTGRGAAPERAHRAGARASLAWSVYVGLGGWSPGQVRATYLGCVSYSDSLLGLVLDALDELPASGVAARAAEAAAASPEGGRTAAATLADEVRVVVLSRSAFVRATRGTRATSDQAG